MYKERIERVLARMKAAGFSQLLISDPKSIFYLTGVSVEPYERMFAFLVREDGHHVLFLNRLFNVPDTEYEEVWFSDTDDSVGMIADHIDRKERLGIDKEWPARFLIPLMERCPELTALLGSDCVDKCRAGRHDGENGR